jgi:hypothetical protein
MAEYTTTDTSDGITGGYTGDSLGLEITMAVFTGLALYNALELIVLLFVTFREYKGLYFWSLLVSAFVGVIPYALGFLLKYFALTPALWLSITLITVGWYAMVTGQSIVLYSRLHLVLRNPKVLQRVLIMIIIDAIVLHIPTTVLTYGSNLSSYNGKIIRGYDVMEKIQMTGFCLQEFTLSGLYIYETAKMLKLNPDPGSRKIMYQLLSLNLLIIFMDVGLLTVEYLNYYIIETTLKGAVYSVKLKLEFAILGQLVNFVRSHGWKLGSSHEPIILPDFVDPTRIPSDITHPTQVSKGYRHHSRMDPESMSIALFEHRDQGRLRSIPIGGSDTSQVTGSSLDGLNTKCTDFLNKKTENPLGNPDHPG